MTDIKTAAERAAAWLEANPDKHIARSLALNTRGRQVHPSSPEADCFCALGRLVVELGLPVVDYQSGAYLQLSDLGIDYDPIYAANDEGSGAPFNVGHRKIKPFHPELGIAALRALAS